MGCSTYSLLHCQQGYLHEQVLLIMAESEPDVSLVSLSSTRLVCSSNGKSSCILRPSAHSQLLRRFSETLLGGCGGSGKLPILCHQRTHISLGAAAEGGSGSGPVPCLPFPSPLGKCVSPGQGTLSALPQEQGLWPLTSRCMVHEPGGSPGFSSPTCPKAAPNSAHAV